MRRALLCGIVVLAVALPAAADGSRSDQAFRDAHGHVLVPTAGGSCGVPASIAALPFSDSGTTCGAANIITSYGGICGTDLPFPYPGPEHVWQFSTGAGSSVAISADLTGSTGDLAIFVIATTCGTAANCMAHSQDAIGPGAGPELIGAQNYPAGTYFIHLDSYYGSGSASCGTYALSVTGTLPVEVTGFTAD